MIVFFVIVILVALALQWYSLRNAGDRRNIRYECKPSVRACEPGDVFLVFSNVSNLGLRPSPAIRIEEHFPKNLEVLEAEQFNVKRMTKEHRIYYSTVVIRGHQQVKRYLRASISRRGEYCFSYADFHAGDFLGFREFDYRMDNDSRIVVYPARLENAGFLQTFTDAVDEIARKKQLLEDPISVCGYRDYTGREPMRQISWMQSAVRNSLIVRQFDPVWEQSVTIALDTQLHGDFDLYVERQELCFSIARTVCEQLEKRRIGYRLVTNAIITGEISAFSSSGGMGGSFGKILYALGAARNGCICSVEELMHTVGTGAVRSEMIVLISTCSDGRVERALGKVRKITRGRILTLFADRLLQNAEKQAHAEGRSDA